MMEKMKKINRNNGITLFTLFIFIILSFSIPSFLSLKNLNIIAVGRVPVGMFAMASVIPLAVGEFDISLGYMIGAVIMLGGKAAESGMSPLGVVAVVLLSSVFFGFINGFITVVLKIPSTISTLATGMVLYSISLGLNGGKAFTSVVPSIILWVGKIRIAKFNISVWIFLLTALFIYYILEHTPFGKYVYGIGFSERVVALSGINTKVVRLLSFVLASFVVGICALILLTQSGNIYPDTGPSYLLPGLAVTFLSITAHTPGRYNIPGVIIAVILLGIVFNGISIMGAPFWAEAVINGIVLLVVVLFAGLNRKR